MPPSKKVCMVCGDKALGYNFNAVTCESCKAFFRRNALLNKEFTCPFSQNCEITVVTRRFCQRCRLEKCFQIGMKKENIMSEEEKVKKKKKIEQNRVKRRLDPTSKTDNTSSVKIKREDGSASIDGWSEKINSPTSQKSVNCNGISPSEFNSNSMSSDSPQQELSNDTPSQLSSTADLPHMPAHLYSATELVDSITADPESASKIINHLMKTQADAVDAMTKIISTPSDAMRLISHLISYPGDALKIISKIMNSPFDALSVFTKFMSSPTDALEIITKIVNSPTDVLQFMQQLVNSPEDAMDIMNKFMNAPAEALRIINRMVNNTTSSADTSCHHGHNNDGNCHSMLNSMLRSVQSPNSSATVSLEKSVPLSVNAASDEGLSTFNSIGSTNHSSNSTSSRIINNNTSSNTQNINCRCSSSISVSENNPTASSSRCSNCKCFNNCTINSSKSSAAKGTNGPDISNMNSSHMKMPRDVLEKILEDVEDRPIHPNSFESVLCEAIKLEYETFNSLPQSMSDNRELNEAEQLKLQELINANKALYYPVDDDLSNIINDDERIKCDGNQLDPQLLKVINLTAVAIRRLIKMSKKINAFRNMCQEDQVALLKGGCTEMMIMRSVMSYDCDHATWKIPHSEEAMSNIKVDVLKLAKGNVYEEHDRFIRTFEPKWRMDENIILIMCAIVLFTPTRPRIIHSDVIKLEQNSYYYLLRRYLESVYPGCEAKSTFIKLIQKINEVQKLNEVIIGVYLNVNPSQVEPLLREIFDLKNH